VPKILNSIQGERFGRLVAVSKVKSSGRQKWNCYCDCGKAAIISYSNLMIGKTKSCGCLNLESTTTHGKSRSKIYRSWIYMKSRCFNPKNTAYKRYGGRGISVCSEWLDFSSFYEDMYASYFDGASLDRINVDGNYEKSNCRWATDKEQGNNKRNTKYLTIGGKKKTFSEWAALAGIKYDCLYSRIYRGHSAYEAVFGMKK